MSSLDSVVETYTPRTFDRGAASDGASAIALQDRADVVGPKPRDSRLVLAVIVSYEPNPELLISLIEPIRGNAAIDVLIVDNSESTEGRNAATAIAGSLGVELILNPRNLGVAEAQNIGLRTALARDYSFVLLLDQDSSLGDRAVERLMAAHRRLVELGERVAAVGPSFLDPRNGLGFPFVRLRRVRMGKLWPSPGAEIECDLLISSGCLVSLEAVRTVGEMDAALFIDYVDFEWCARARAAGYKVFGISDAKMRHTIGTGAFKIFGRLIMVHAPIRHYYLIRNALLFARKPYLDWRWRAHLVYRAVAQLMLFTVLCPRRIERLGWMLRGLMDGLLGRGGRLAGSNERVRRTSLGLTR